MFEEKDDTILARWLAGELTPDELSEFQDSKEFLEYQAIIEASNRFEKPSYDKDKLYDKILEKRHVKTKVIRLSKISYYAVGIAASVILIIGVFFNTKTYQTHIGEQLTVLLPDNSSVQLNANSKLTHSRFFWSSNRAVTLKGEGYFKVETGNTFSVNSDYGTVSVLGTEFNIRARKNRYDLKCYEGKVQFSQNETNKIAILTKDMAISIENNIIKEDTHKTKAPSWLEGISTFNDATLNTVLDELQSYYGVTFDTNNIDLSQRYSGFFIHSNLNDALESVLAPMQIKYELRNNTVILNSL